MHFIGNKKVVAMLAKSLEKDALNHAYIFSGPESVGKFTLAKMFALSAISGESLVLDVEHVDKDALLDLILVAPETVEKNKVIKQRDISIETIREAKLALSLYPYHGKYKILIVKDAHRLNVSAQNALLKILEEPNPTTILILVTHESDRILPTILSRCQMLNFSLVGEADMTSSFGSAEIVSLATGRPGLAALLSQDGNQKEFRKVAQNQLEKISTSSLNERFILADEYSKDVQRTLEKMNIWIWGIREKALENSDADAARRQMSEFAKIEKIQKSATLLKRTNANSKLILETLFMDL